MKFSDLGITILGALFLTAAEAKDPITIVGTDGCSYFNPDPEQNNVFTVMKGETTKYEVNGAYNLDVIKAIVKSAGCDDKFEGENMITEEKVGLK